MMTYAIIAVAIVVVLGIAVPQIMDWQARKQREKYRQAQLKADARREAILTDIETSLKRRGQVDRKRTQTDGRRKENRNTDDEYDDGILDGVLADDLIEGGIDLLQRPTSSLLNRFKGNGGSFGGGGATVELTDQLRTHLPEDHKVDILPPVDTDIDLRPEAEHFTPLGDDGPGIVESVGEAFSSASETVSDFVSSIGDAVGDFDFDD
jgi:hypothetical protein